MSIGTFIGLNELIGAPFHAESGALLGLIHWSLDLLGLSGLRGIRSSGLTTSRLNFLDGDLPGDGE